LLITNKDNCITHSGNVTHTQEECSWERTLQEASLGWERTNTLI